MPRFQRNGVDDDAYQTNVITSDITYMKDTYCVAGWSPSTGQMKRLMINGNHWSDKDLKKVGKYASLNVNVIPKESGRNYPHKTEDTNIDENFKVVRHYEKPEALIKDLRPATSKTIQDAFGGNIKKNSYVKFQTKCPSLGGVIMPAKNVQFLKKMENCVLIYWIMMAQIMMCALHAGICAMFLTLCPQKNSRDLRPRWKIVIRRPMFVLV